jgi:transposase
MMEYKYVKHFTCWNQMLALIKSIKWKRKLPKSVLLRCEYRIDWILSKAILSRATSISQILGWRTETWVCLLDQHNAHSALQVAELYKNRWQVELFFKWLKQHLKIKKFWGTTYCSDSNLCCHLHLLLSCNCSERYATW